MRIGTWNVSSGVDMSNYKGELFDKTPEVNINDKSLVGIAKAIVDYKLDVVALQEVTTTDSFKFVEQLSNLTGLKYFVKFENSPGFLIKNTSIGTAILSKYPIEEKETFLFENPNLTKMTKNGLYKTHDKGFICASIVADKKYKIISTQLLPFHKFDANIFDYKNIYNDFQEYIIKNKPIVCGDFNVVSGKVALQQLLDKVTPAYNFVFNQITTTDNKKTDNILLPKGVKVVEKKLADDIKISDHFLCYVEI